MITNELLYRGGTHIIALGYSWLTG